MFKPTSPNTQKAFTLVELLTVMVVLVALASITIKTTAQFSFDSRYQITQDRYDKIKTAILGNPNQTINGYPSVSGFVADMGRLPSCLRELIDGWDCAATTPQVGSITPYQIDKDHCSDTTKTTQATCISPATWITTTNTGLGYGWRGAYIETTNDPNNSNAFTDGWGRIDYTLNVCTDSTYTNKDDCIANSGKWFNPNYGWEFSPDQASPNTTTLTIKSYGKDQMVGGVEDYDKDYPQTTLPTVNSYDWQIVPPATASVTTTPLPLTLTTNVTFNSSGTATASSVTINGVSIIPSVAINISGTVATITATTTSDVCLAIYNTTTGISNPIKSDNRTLNYTSTGILAVPTTFPTTLTATLTSQLTPIPFFTLQSPPASLAFGQIAFSVNKYDTATSTCTSSIVPSAFHTSPKILTILPRHNFVFNEDW